MNLELKHNFSTSLLADGHIIAETVGNNNFIKVQNGVYKNEEKNSCLFLPGKYNILVKKDGCKDVTAKLMVSSVMSLSDISGGELAIEDQVINCDMEC